MVTEKHVNKMFRRLKYVEYYSREKTQYMSVQIQQKDHKKADQLWT